MSDIIRPQPQLPERPCLPPRPKPMEPLRPEQFSPPGQQQPQQQQQRSPEQITETYQAPSAIYEEIQDDIVSII